MAMPSSGPISLQDARVEFGVSGAISLGQLYRGGGIVPNTPANAGVPVSGAISLANLYGARQYTGMSGSATGSTVTYDNGANAAPETRVLAGTAIASVSGGTGSYSYSWSVLSSSAVSGVSLTNASTNTVTVTATATLNSPGSVIVRCTISDGVSSIARDTSVDFFYFNNI